MLNIATVKIIDKKDDISLSRKIIFNIKTTNPITTIRTIMK